MRETTLTVPNPPTPSRLDHFLVANLAGLSRRKVKGLIDAGQVRVNGRTERRAGLSLRAGTRIEVAWRPSLLPPVGLDRTAVIAEGAGWLAVDKPSGLPTHRTDEGATGVPEALGAALGVPPEDLLIVHRLDRGTSGVLLIARTPTAAAALAARFVAGEMRKTYRAIVHPAPPADAGARLDDDPKGPMELSWRVVRRSADGSRAEVEACPKQGRTHQVRRQLAAAGTPIVGDLEHGGAAPGGAERLALHCLTMAWAEHAVRAELPPGWDALLELPAPVLAATTPAASVIHAPPRPRRRTGPALPTLAVSAASARILRGGHPWVLRDRETGSLRSFAPGDQALLVDPRGQAIGVALVDPTASCCARLMEAGRESGFSDAEVGERALTAVQRRTALLDDPATTALRLVHAEADGLPGLTVDLWGDLLVATRTTEAVSSLTHAVYAALRERLGDRPLYEKDHVEDLRQRGRGREGDVLPGRWVVPPRGALPEPTLCAEDGLHFEVTPTQGLTTGFYPDQRENRRSLAGRLRAGDRVLNLFGHTGAFSVRAAAAGAGRAVTIDLSPKYCAWTEANLRRNGLDPVRHPAIAAPCDAWLASAEERFDGVVIDPPAFARARTGSGGWSARRDYRGLVAASARALDPGGGWILAVVNLKGIKSSWLRAEVLAGVREAGRAPGRAQDAPPSPDSPRLRGFPEGTAFHGVLIEVGAD